MLQLSKKYHPKDWVAFLDVFFLQKFQSKIIIKHLKEGKEMGGERKKKHFKIKFIKVRDFLKQKTK